MPAKVSDDKNKNRPKHKPYHLYYPKPEKPIYTEYPLYSHPYKQKIPEDVYIPIEKKPPTKLKSVKEYEKDKKKKFKVKPKPQYSPPYDFGSIQQYGTPPPPFSPSIPPHIPPFLPPPMHQMTPYPPVPPPTTTPPPSTYPQPTYPPPYEPYGPPASTEPIALVTKPAAQATVQTEQTPIVTPTPSQTQYPPYTPAPWPPPAYQTYPPYWSSIYPFTQSKIFKKFSEIPLFLIFLVCISIYWFPFIISNIIGAPVYLFSENENLAEIITGVFLCIITIILMLFVRSYLDKPTLKDYGLSTDNLGSNLALTAKLIFIIYAVEWIVVFLFSVLGVSFEGGPVEVNIYFIISAVIIAPIFEETVYRANASTLLARRLPIIWVAIITSTWFIAKHIPMWHFDNGFGLPALGVILLADIPLWTIVTYYYLKRKCIWIPFFVHMFNNGSIVLFYYLPNTWDFIFDTTFLLIGGISIFVFGVPWFYKKIYKRYLEGKFEATTYSVHFLVISMALTISLLVTSEALVGIQNFNEYVCIPIGLGLFLISIITFGYVISNRNIEYVKDLPSYVKFS